MPFRGIAAKCLRALIRSIFSKFAVECTCVQNPAIGLMIGQASWKKIDLTRAPKHLEALLSLDY